MKDNDSFDDIPMVAPASDEIASYNRARGAKPAARAGSGGMGGGAKFFLFLAFMLAAASCAGAYYLFEELKKTTAALESSTARVESLEQRLSSTDESVSESATVQGVKIKELTSEVDKLWASAWRKNQAEIGKYSKQLATQTANLDKTKESLKAQQESLANLQNQLGEAQAMSGLIKEVQASSIAHQAQLSELDDTLAALKVSSNGLQKKVKENEEWVQSFNTFRRQVNSKISQLEDTVQTQLRGPASQSSLPLPE